MSRHIELKDDEFLTKGLRLHGLSVDTPSQLSDAFRSGALYARDNMQSSAAQGARVNEALGKAIEQTCNVIREAGKNEYDKDELDDICNQVYLVFGRAVSAAVAQPSDATAQWKPADDAVLLCVACSETIAAQPRVDLTDEQMLAAFNSAESVIDGLHEVRKLLANTAQGKPEYMPTDPEYIKALDEGRERIAAHWAEYRKTQNNGRG